MPKFEEQESNKNRIVMYPNHEIEQLVASRSPISRYVVGMFRIENDALRPRKTKRPTDRPIFQVKEASREIPHSVKIELESTASEVEVSAKSVAKSVYSNVEQYCCNSTLHGLKYIGDSSLSFVERLFWIIAFVCAVAFAAYFISSIYEKYNINPVIISVNPNLVPLETIPFPAITICNMNQAKKSEAETILQSGTDAEKMLLDDLCNSNTTVLNVSAANDQTSKWGTVQAFMIRVSQSCQDMIKMCKWEDKETSCETLFNMGITDEGLCCTFNQLPRDIIFRNPREVTDWNLTFPPDVEDWSPERGYLKNSSWNAIPRRPSGAGTRLGLTIVVDAETESYYCSSTDSVGFKILLHNPIETPRMADFAFLLQPGVESRILITPKISDATPTLSSIDVRKRLCFFVSERELRFYRRYSQRNCKLECQANYTLEHCNCVPIYLPKSKIQKICGTKEEACIDAAKEIMDKEVQQGIGTTCDCLPGCFELGYENTATFGKFNEVLKIKDDFLKNGSFPYFIKNVALIHFYFAGTQFTSNTKSELYGFSEFLSNTGGLLGLFMGFSFLSAVEIIYYLTLRMCCKLIRSNNIKQICNKQNERKRESQLYPFAQ